MTITGSIESTQYLFDAGARNSVKQARRRLIFGNTGTTTGWEKTKVRRFLQKHQDAFTLHKQTRLAAASFPVCPTPLAGTPQPLL
jgi:hypothetical protein